MNNIVKKIILSAMTTVISATALLTTSAFADDMSGWALSEYEAATSAGLVSYSVVSNNLKENITRKEFCELAVNLYKKLTNENLIEPAGSPFTDTDSVAVAQAYCYGLVSGTGDNTFTPDRLVTREEAAKMLVSTLTAAEVPFNLSDGETDAYVIESFDDDYNVSSWAKAAVITSLNYSLMNGINDSTFGAKDATTREQAIASVNRSYNAFGNSGVYLELPSIYLPEDGAVIEEDDFTVSWSPISSTDEYHVIIKDANANAVFLKDVSGQSSITVPKGSLTTNRAYTITVGAIISDSEVYSLPVAFTYTTKAPIPNEQYIAEHPVAQELLDEAAKYLGTPYVWGGTSPSGFDCSGFVQYVYNKMGISIKRVADDQLHGKGEYISAMKDLEPGDLVFFGSGDYASHVGMYVGDGTMIHSPSTGKTIEYTDIVNSSYYSSRFIGGRRIVE